MNLETRKANRHWHEPLDATLDAWQNFTDLHAQLTRPGRRGMSVGEMVGVAAQMGLLDPRPRSSESVWLDAEEKP
jgi:hypothetical protein